MYCPNFEGECSASCENRCIIAHRPSEASCHGSCDPAESRIMTYFRRSGKRWAACHSEVSSTHLSRLRHPIGRDRWPMHQRRQAVLQAWTPWVNPCSHSHAALPNFLPPDSYSTCLRFAHCNLKPISFGPEGSKRKMRASSHPWAKPGAKTVGSGDPPWAFQYDVCSPAANQLQT